MLKLYQVSKLFSKEFEGTYRDVWLFIYFENKITNIHITFTAGTTRKDNTTFLFLGWHALFVRNWSYAYFMYCNALFFIDRCVFFSSLYQNDILYILYDTKLQLHTINMWLSASLFFTRPLYFCISIHLEFDISKLHKF